MHIFLLINMTNTAKTTLSLKNNIYTHNKLYRAIHVIAKTLFIKKECTKTQY